MPHTLTRADVGGWILTGERLSAQFTQDQKAAGASTTGVSDVSKRIERRKSYLEEVEKRNDSGLGVLLIAAFLGPAFVILAVAFGSGYMDELYLRTLSAQ